MKTITVAEMRNNFDGFLAALKEEEDEIVLLDEDREIAHIVPEPKTMTLQEIFADSDDRLGEEAGAALAEAVEKFRSSPGNRLAAQRKPWAG